jgi:hypothetical protein
MSGTSSTLEVNDKCVQNCSHKISKFAGYYVDFNMFICSYSSYGLNNKVTVNICHICTHYFNRDSPNISKATSFYTLQADKTILLRVDGTAVFVELILPECS